MNLCTKRLLLRPFTSDDITDDYLYWLRDPKVTRFSNQRFREHNKESCSTYQQSFNKSTNSFLLLLHRRDATPIGTMTVYRKPEHGTADIGLMLGNRAYWRQGLGLEAWITVMNVVLQEKGMRKVTGGTVKTNSAMVKIMEQSGMKLDAVRERQELIEGQAVDLLHYSRFTEDLA